MDAGTGVLFDFLIPMKSVVYCSAESYSKGGGPAEKLRTNAPVSAYGVVSKSTGDDNPGGGMVKFL